MSDARGHRLVFVPSFSMGTVRRFDSTFPADDAMLLDQFEVVRALASASERAEAAGGALEVVVKCLRGAESSAVLREFTEGLGAPAVRYSEAQLSGELGSATAAVLDYPSSALRETEALGVPTLVLVYPGLQLRATGVAVLRHARMERYGRRGEIAPLVTAFVGSLGPTREAGTGRALA